MSVRDIGALCPKWNVFIQLLTERLRDLCRRIGRKILRARENGWVKNPKSFRNNSVTHKWIHIDCGSVHCACKVSSQTKSQPWVGEVSQVPSHNHEDIQNSYLEIQKITFLQETRDIRHINHTPKQTPWSEVVS